VKPNRARSVYLIVVLLSASLCTAASDMLDAGLARKLAPAVARVSLQHKSTLALLSYCSQHYNQLKTSASHAVSTWVRNNQKILSKAEAIRLRLLDDISHKQTPLDAEQFALAIDTAVQRSVQQCRQALAAYPKKQQHYLCNRLILSVTAGEWDVQVKQHDAYSILENFH